MLDKYSGGRQTKMVCSRISVSLVARFGDQNPRTVANASPLSYRIVEKTEINRHRYRRLLPCEYDHVGRELKVVG